MPVETSNRWLVNLLFMHAWDVVIQDGRFRSHDWVVKVDMDAVFLPVRLREHLRGNTTEKGERVFFTNCDR